MAQHVKCLLNKCENLSSNPQNPCESWAQCFYSKMGSGDRMPRLVGQSTWYMQQWTTKERHCIKQGARKRLIFTYVSWHAQIYTHIHEYAHTCTSHTYILAHIYIIHFSSFISVAVTDTLTKSNFVQEMSHLTQNCRSQCSIKAGSCRQTCLVSHTAFITFDHLLHNKTSTAGSMKNPAAWLGGRLLLRWHRIWS